MLSELFEVFCFYVNKEKRIVEYAALMVPNDSYPPQIRVYWHKQQGIMDAQKWEPFHFGQANECEQITLDFVKVALPRDKPHSPALARQWTFNNLDALKVPVFGISPVKQISEELMACEAIENITERIVYR